MGLLWNFALIAIFIFTLIGFLKGNAFSAFIFGLVLYKIVQKIMERFD